MEKEFGAVNKWMCGDAFNTAADPAYRRLQELDLGEAMMNLHDAKAPAADRPGLKA